MKLIEINSLKVFDFPESDIIDFSCDGTEFEHKILDSCFYPALNKDRITGFTNRIINDTRVFNLTVNKDLFFKNFVLVE